MAKMHINLTFLAVNDELDRYLLSAPDLTSLGISEFELRLHLMKYVLSRCQDRFKWVEKNENHPHSVDIPCAPIEQRIEIEMLIHEGLQSLLEQISNETDPKGNQDGKTLDSESSDKSQFSK